MNGQQLLREWLPPAVYRWLRQSRVPRLGARPLHDIDRQLAELLPARGVYIEIGANDGLTQSNTWWLERDRGWKGLLIEPALNRFLELQQNRGEQNVFSCSACVPFDFPRSFVSMTYADLMTTAGEVDLLDVDRDEHHRAASDHAPRQVPFLATARCLSDLIDESGIGPAIDFFSLDVEGAELAVLGGLDFSRHKPTWILVETRRKELVDSFLMQHGYGPARSLSIHDYLYERAATAS